MIPPATTLIFLGRSGCGKGTQIGFLKAKPEFANALELKTGELFRELSKSNSILGQKVKEILDAGLLMPMWLALSLWVREFDRITDEEILLLDGIPRRLDEAKLLDEALPFLGRPKAVTVVLNVSAEESRRRLLARRRADDTEERIKNRLSWYETNVIPELEYYRGEGRLIDVDGEQSPEGVFEELWQKVNRYFA